MGEANRWGSEEVETRKPEMVEEKEVVWTDGAESKRGSE